MALGSRLERKMEKGSSAEIRNGGAWATKCVYIVKHVSLFTRVVQPLRVLCPAPHSNAHQFTSSTLEPCTFCALFFNFASASVSQDHGFKLFLVCPFPFLFFSFLFDLLFYILFYCFCFNYPSFFYLSVLIIYVFRTSYFCALSFYLFFTPWGQCVI